MPALSDHPPRNARADLTSHASCSTPPSKAAKPFATIERQTQGKEQQHERMVQKLRETEAEAKRIKRTVSREQLDVKMGELFSRWGV